MKKHLFFWLRLCASLLVMILLILSMDIRSMDVGTVLRNISRHGWFYLGLSIVILNLDRFLMSYKWSILLAARGIPFSFPELVKSYFIGTTWGSILPGTVGGDIVRTYQISKQGTAGTDVVSSVIVERALGTVASLLMVAMCMLSAVMVMHVFPWWVAVVTLLGGCAFVGLAWRVLGQIRTTDKTAAPPRSRWVTRLTSIYDACLGYRKHPGVLVRFVAWSFIEQCVPVVCVYLTALALDIPASFLSLATFTPLVVMVAKVPVSLDGFGVREGLYVHLLALVGVSSSGAFTLGLIAHIIGNASLLPGFLISVLTRQRQAIPTS